MTWSFARVASENRRSSAIAFTTDVEMWTWRLHGEVEKSIIVTMSFSMIRTGVMEL